MFLPLPVCPSVCPLGSSVSLLVSVSLSLSYGLWAARTSSVHLSLECSALLSLSHPLHSSESVPPSLSECSLLPLGL